MTKPTSTLLLSLVRHFTGALEAFKTWVMEVTKNPT